MTDLAPTATVTLHPGAAPAPPDAATLVGFARLEAKLDVALAHQGAAIESQGARITSQEAVGADHESRLRRLEERRTIEPKELWGAVVGAAGLVLTVVTLWNALVPSA